MEQDSSVNDINQKETAQAGEDIASNIETREGRFKYKIKLPKIVWLLIGVGLAILGGYLFYFNFLMSPKRIMAKMISNMTEVKSYEYMALFDFTNSEIGGTNMYSVRVSGQNDYQNPESVELSTNIEAYANDIKVAGVEMVSVDQTLYAKIAYLLNLGYDLESIKYNWVKIDFAQMYEKYLGEEMITLDRGEEHELTDEERRELRELLKDTQIFEVTEQLKKEEVNGVSTFRYKYNINEENIKTAYLLIQERITEKIPSYLQSTNDDVEKELDQLLEEIDFRSGEIWIGVNDKLLRKITFDVSFGEGVNAVEIKGDIELTNFNNDFNISEPQDFMSIEEFLTKGVEIINEIQREYFENLEESESELDIQDFLGVTSEKEQ